MVPPPLFYALSITRTLDFRKTHKTKKAMSAPLFNFRLARPAHKAIAKAASELHCDRSTLVRAALIEFLDGLHQEGLISEGPPPVVAPTHFLR